MFYNVRRFAFMATFLCVLGLLMCGQAAEKTSRAHVRPFKAVGVAVWDNILAGFTTGANFSGTGQGTHLGNFVQSGNLFFTGGPDQNGVIPGQGSVTLKAANGDELRFSYAGTLNSANGIGQGNLTFIGGTGRFENASGAGTFYAEIQGVVNAPMKVWLNGTVSY